MRKTNRLHSVIFPVISFVLVLFLLLQIFLFGRIPPGPKEQELTITKPNAVSENKYDLRSGYYNSIWPSEHADLIRSHAVLSGGLPKDFGRTKLQVSSTEIHMPTWGYIRNEDEVFIIGGSPQLMTTFTESIESGKNIPGIKSLTNNVKDIFSGDIPYVEKLIQKPWRRPY